MNQILVTNNYYIIKNKLYKKYIILFFTSLILFLFILFYSFHSFLTRLHFSQKTNILKSKYNIYALYPSRNFSSHLKLTNDIYIIGTIEIPMLNISYPIIENTSEDLLKISVCRFSGPLPNRIGNLCILGHNYKNNTMFSNLHKLNIGESIFITDLNNTKLEYIIYDKLNISDSNLDCTKSSNIIEITLITCNNIDNTKRTVIKAKMKG